MSQMNAYVEFYHFGEWYQVINGGALLLQHSDLNGCLFGVDNYAGYKPLFADRGMPKDLSVNLAQHYEEVQKYTFGQSWVLYDELTAIDWDEFAERRDERVHEYNVSIEGEKFVTKWLHKPGHEHIILELENTNEVKHKDLVFRRPILRRRDALADTEFPTLVKLMAILADRWGPLSTRLVVYFD